MELHVDTHDLAPQIAASLSIGARAFKKLRTSLNGDGSIQYRVDNESGVSLSAEAFADLNRMMDVVAVDNLERPFFIIFDEDRKLALELVVGRAGDEGYCEHDDELVLRSMLRLETYRSASFSDLRLSRGHTHPVFFDSGSRRLGTGFGGFSKSTGRTFGAMPSNIFGDLATWQQRQVSSSCSPARQAIIGEIIKSRAYKKFCEDYVESYHASHSPGFNGPAEGLGSRFHWIVTPRLRQIGVFETPVDEYGVVVYHHWSVQSAIVPELSSRCLWCTHNDCIERLDSFSSLEDLLQHVRVQHPEE